MVVPAIPSPCYLAPNTMSLVSNEPQLPTDAEAAAATSADDPTSVGYPQATQPFRVVWSYAIILTLIHVVAFLAVLPYFFTWSGVILAILGHFLFGMMGITIGYHRLLTHRGFSCPKWLEHTLALLGMCNLQDSPARWVAIHRVHHQHSDHEPDPHTPLANFLWAHVGWVVCRHRDLDRTTHYERYVRDLLRDPFYLRMERYGGWFFVFLAHTVVITAAGAVYGYWQSGGITAEAIRYAGSWYVWAVAVRTVLVLHGTWSVNSLSHVLGYRNYQTRDNSRNNWLVALFTHGEGWHNNHHAQPRSARHGHFWWEFDMSWWVIVAMEKLGLIQQVVRPKHGAKPEESAV